MTNKVISVEYNLYKDTADGEMIESTVGREPLTFLSGVGQMIPDFEANITPLNAGDEFSFGIAAAMAYGERNDEAIIDLPKDMFMHEGALAPEVVVDNVLRLQDDHGRVHPAKVVSVNEASITMDVNHPLAGQDLHFTGKVLNVRSATADELAHGHVHGEGGVHH